MYLYEIRISVCCRLGPVWKNFSILITFMILEGLRNDSQMNYQYEPGIRVCCHSEPTRDPMLCKLVNQTRTRNVDWGD